MKGKRPRGRKGGCGGWVRYSTKKEREVNEEKERHLKTGARERGSGERRRTGQDRL